MVGTVASYRIERYVSHTSISTFDLPTAQNLPEFGASDFNEIAAW